MMISCEVGSKIIFYTAGSDSDCQTYTLRQGCYSLQACSANVTLSFANIVADDIDDDGLNDDYYYDDYTDAER